MPRYRSRMLSWLLGDPQPSMQHVQLSWRLMVFAGPLGLVVGLLVVGFIDLVQSVNHLFFAVDLQGRLDVKPGQASWMLPLIVMLAGLGVGLIRHLLIRGPHIHTLTDIVYYVVKHRARIPTRTGFWSTIANALTLAGGGSAGAQSPVVHFGAWIAAMIARKFHVNQHDRKLLVGCAVAAAISSAFNAPVGGAFFALEVVLGHFSPVIFAPVVLSAVAGSIIARQFHGNNVAFSMPDYQLASLSELPAFILLGCICALVAIALARSVAIVRITTQHIGIPGWMKPALGGLLVGLLATFWPHILGMGGGTTQWVLASDLPLLLLLVWAVVKTIATALTIGSGMGG
ncbi:MAG: chloride channel protein, partial [Pseudomonadota bacterium]